MGASDSASLRVDADVSRLREIRAFVRANGRSLGADDASISDLVQAVDEWVTNVIVHGYRGAAGPIEIDLRREAGEIVVRVRDAAPPFDPATAPPFDPGLPLERRPVGKMGLHLIRELCDRFEHRVPVGGGNEIAIVKAAGGGPGETGGNT